MAPRGLSAEEKRVKLLEIFHETKDFFQLKELEKLGPKMKGIVTQSVKEVLQSLVDDNLVQSDKIGSSNFFWSFPSQRGAIMQNRLDSAAEARAASEKQLTELQLAISGERAARPESVTKFPALFRTIPFFARPGLFCRLSSLLLLSLLLLSLSHGPRARDPRTDADALGQDEREAALARLAAARKTTSELQAELEAYGACDPIKVEEKRRAVVLAREAALRHTDNYSILMSHFTRQHNVDPQDIRAYLGVGIDYEELS